MNPTAKQRRQIAGWIKKWQRRMLLDSWRVSGPDFAERTRPDESLTVFVESVVDPAYTTIKMTVFPEFWSLTEPEQERWIVHELAHGPVAALGEMAQRAVRRRQAIKQDANRAEESLVEWIANTAWRAYGGR